ncbi:MAG TPA: hypothetical protein PKE57_12305, partial [Cellvibrionaceae bacterium]|nr:hypothetical protein [Cellvibrionaceae bacterium]
MQRDTTKKGSDYTAFFNSIAQKLLFDLQEIAMAQPIVQPATASQLAACVYESLGLTMQNSTQPTIDPGHQRVLIFARGYRGAYDNELTRQRARKTTSKCCNYRDFAVQNDSLAKSCASPIPIRKASSGTLPPPKLTSNDQTTFIHRISMRILMAPMEGVVDPYLRALYCQIGGIDLFVTEFIRVTHTLLPAKLFLRL